MHQDARTNLGSNVWVRRYGTVPPTATALEHWMLIKAGCGVSDPHWLQEIKGNKR